MSTELDELKKINTKLEKLTKIFTKIKEQVYVLIANTQGLKVDENNEEAGNNNVG